MYDNNQQSALGVKNCKVNNYLQTHKSSPPGELPRYDLLRKLETNPVGCLYFLYSIFYALVLFRKHRAPKNHFGTIFTFPGNKCTFMLIWDLPASPKSIMPGDSS